jgi:integrase
MPKLTKSVVDAAQVSASATFLWDSELKGFGIKILPSGSRQFVCQYRAGHGRGSPTRRITIGRYGPVTPDQARREAKRILGAAAGGADPAAEKRARKQAQRAPQDTVRDVAAEWLRRDQATKRTLYEIRRILDRDVLPVIGDKPIVELRKRDVIELLDSVVDRGAPTMANRVLSLVKRLLTWAAGRDIVEANVAAYIEPPAAKVSRDRVLTDAELIDVWRAAERLGGPYGAGVRLLMLTGARRAEIFGLQESELDLAEAMIRLPAGRVKNGEGRTIPLSAQAIAIFDTLPRLGPYLLSGSGKHPKSDHAQSKRRLDALLPDLPHWVVHDLRRSCATGLQRLGARLETIEAVLGHTSGSRRGVVGTYQRHRFEAEARVALDVWGRHIEGLLTGTTDNVVPIAGRR